MYELAKENQLHFELLVDKHTALARTERAQAH